MSGRRIGVIGLGRSGRSAALLALARGADLYATDSGDSPTLQGAAEAVRHAGGRVELGGYSIDELARCELLVLSPGIPPTAPVLTEPELSGIPQVSELDFAFGYLRAPVLAITGTNGKTTTTALASHLLEESGLRAPAAGNIGTALSEIALLDDSPDWVVVEASSFQLAGTRAFAPRIGVLTNLASDHLDRYPSLEAYYADKAKLFERADEGCSWILNGDDQSVLELADGAVGDRYLFSVNRELSDDELGGYLSASGELRVRLQSGESALVDQSEFALLGAHNIANALAGSIGALLAGAEIDSVRRGLRSFRALPHRLEPVAEGGGVLWINDSKATNISSTLVALQGMTHPTVLLLGGRHKGESYRGLIPELVDRVRLVVAYGEAGAQIEEELRETLPVALVDGPFEEVVDRAANSAHPGDAVLLSPACSSYDLFRDYEERGERFRELALRVTGSGREDEEASGGGEAGDE